MKSKLLSGFFAVLTCWLGFPNPIIHLPLLALCFPGIMLILALKSKSNRQAFSFGLLTGMFAYSACLYWIAVPVHDYGYMPWIVSLPFPVLLGTYVALYSGLFCLLVRKFCPLFTGWRLPLESSTPIKAIPILKLIVFCSLLWAGLEYLRGWLFTGFPWLTLSSAFVPWSWAIQGLSALGGYALSGLYAGIAVSFTITAYYLHNKSKAQSLSPLLAPAAFFIPVMLFLVLWTTEAFSPKANSTQAIGVVMVQGNINQDQKWNPGAQQATFQHYRRLTEVALDEIARGKIRFDHISSDETPPYEPPFKLVIWPETAMPFFYQYGGALSQGIAELARRNNVYLLFGSPDKESAPNKSFSEFPVFNRAYLLNPNGETIGVYDKEHLVPFGEYAPPWLKFPILEFLLAEVGDLDPGVYTPPLKAGDVRMGILICYEVIFQELAQKRVADGANILITISNDAWFGSTAAPEQHLQLGIMRAVEQGRWLVRATNTGITVIVNPLGERTRQGNSFVAETLTGLAYTQQTTTFFHKIEPYLPYLILLALILLVAPGYISRKIHKINK